MAGQIMEDDELLDLGRFVDQDSPLGAEVGDGLSMGCIVPVGPVGSGPHGSAPSSGRGSPGPHRAGSTSPSVSSYRGKWPAAAGPVMSPPTQQHRDPASDVFREAVAIPGVRAVALRAGRRAAAVPHCPPRAAGGIFVGQLPVGYSAEDVAELLMAVGAAGGAAVDVKTVKMHPRGTCAFVEVNVDAVATVTAFNRRVLCDTNTLWVAGDDVAGARLADVAAYPTDAASGVPKATIVLERSTKDPKRRQRGPQHADLPPPSAPHYAPNHYAPRHHTAPMYAPIAPLPYPTTTSTQAPAPAYATPMHHQHQQLFPLRPPAQGALVGEFRSPPPLTTMSFSFPAPPPQAHQLVQPHRPQAQALDSAPTTHLLFDVRTGQYVPLTLPGSAPAPAVAQASPPAPAGPFYGAPPVPQNFAPHVPQSFAPTGPQSLAPHCGRCRTPFALATAYAPTACVQCGAGIQPRAATYRCASCPAAVCPHCMARSL